MKENIVTVFANTEYTVTQRLKFTIREVCSSENSQLCQMIQNSFHDGKYPLEEQHRNFSNSLQVINRSDSDDMQSSEIKIEVRIHGLYILSNYVSNIEHLPGVIEADVLDSFKILCRRLGRIKDNPGKPKGTTESTEKLLLPE